MTMNAPNCPKCGAMMIQRESKKTGKKFWGCSKFPRCNGMSFENTYEKKTIVKQAMPTNVHGTPQQESIWNAATMIKNHLIIDALAGSGKTFTITYFLRHITGKIIFVAFNRHIVDELLTRVPDGVEVKTMNSLGYSVVKAWLPKVRFNENKLWDILESIIPQDDESTAFLSEATYKLTNLCKYNLYDGTDDQLDSLVLQHGIEVNDSRNQVYSYVRIALKESKKRINEVDFTDQLWFVYAHKLAVTQYDYMLGDEIQDWNRLQQYVALEAIKNNGRFIGVGDQNQAIYGFAGADTQSIPNMIMMLEQTKRGIQVMPLTYTRRCPKTHVTLAQAIVPALEAMDEAKEGTVNRMTRDQAITAMNAGNMGICRRNAPLISIAYEMIRNGKSVIVRGRDIGKSLQSLITKLKSDTIDQLLDKAEEYRAKEIEKLQKKGKKAENAIQSLNDKIDTLIALTDGKNTIDQVRRSIETLFSDNNAVNSIILSSVHRSKGLESDSVFIFEYARIRLPLSDAEFAQQEANLEYIALTRSKDTLTLVD